MNRNDLIARVADRTGGSQREAAEAVTAALDVITQAVADGETVTLSAFGTFEARQRPARTGRNPRTGEALEIAATVAPAFKPAVSFKRQVARGGDA